MAQDGLSEHLDSLRIDDQHRAGGPSKGSRMPPWVGFLLVIGAMGAMGWGVMALRSRSSEVEVARVTTLETHEASAVLVASGYVIAHHKIELSSKVMGKVAWVGVEKGDLVKKGQVLVRLEDMEYKANMLQAQGTLSAAQAHYEEQKNGSLPQEIDRAKAQAEQAQHQMKIAKVQLDRQVGLFKDGVVSKSDLDNAQATYDQSKANYEALLKTYDLTKIGPRREEIENARGLAEQARGALEYAKTQLDATEIRSPVDGTVLDRLVEMGEMVTTSFVGDRGAKSSVVSLADLQDLQVELDINQNDFARVQQNQATTVVADAYPDRKYQGKVFELSPEANRQKGTVQVKVTVLNPDGMLRPDMAAKVSFHPAGGGEKKGVELLIPKSAVFQLGGKTTVACVDNGHVALKAVELGDTRNDSVRVSSGLSGSETVVVSNPQSLQDGQRVRVK